MEIKFFLNKLVKIDNIEEYTLSALDELQKVYDKFLEKSEGVDPDYPLLKIGGKSEDNIIKTKKNNRYTLIGEEDDDKVRKKHGR